MKFNKDETVICALGGLGEVGKNMYMFMHDDEIYVIDCGVMFPEDELLGIDYVIQDFTYLKQNEDKIKGLIITHGHEDHIGGIPFLLQSVNIPVIYAPKIAADLINKKLVERNIPYNNMTIIDGDSKIKSKYFEIEFVRTTHSIPDSYAVLLKTPNGNIFETGDYKFDLTPIGPIADIQGMARIGSDGVKLLMSDSTNSLSEGFSKSESAVDEALNDIISNHLGRIIIATFASNIYRLKHIIDSCEENGRKIVVFGRSMENAIAIALENGMIKDKTIIIDANQAKDLKHKEVCILCTGTQGEPLAALSRIANGTHKQVSLLDDDLVLFSSSPIPGNAASINRVINKLYLKGVKVFTNTLLTDIHTSGHAKQEEQKLMFRLIQPEYFMPMHGEYRMLKEQVKTAVECGVKEDNCFVMNNGDTLLLTKNGVKRGQNITAGDIYVDGSRIGDVGSIVVNDRKIMSKDGILVAILNIDPKNKKLLIKPNITTRGFILVNENAELINTIEKKITEVVNDFLKNNEYSYADLRNNIILETHPFIAKLTGRRPMVIPVIMEVKKD
ncbi:MAG: ribonuclease J [Firmicutes bacterium]|nr:ribonuclease J [Bacillota bacterium]